MDFKPADFAELLHEALVEILATDGKHQIIAQEPKFITISGIKGVKHIVEITPGFTFNYVEKANQVETEAGKKKKPKNTCPEISAVEPQDKVFKGILLYDNNLNAHFATFPKLHTSNGEAKNIATKGNFLKMTRLFKTLSKIGQREIQFSKTRGYFIQCLLFNVPHALFVHKPPQPVVQYEDGHDAESYEIQQVFYKVLNYLLNCNNIFEFACQNLVWQLFGNAAEFWSPRAAANFIQNIKYIYDTFPEGRLTLT
jgi:hypothetical protein